jgi:hypothetical protein
MGVIPWRWFDYFLPSRRCILRVKYKCENQWSYLAVQIHTRHPHPGKSLLAIEGNLALGDVNLHRTNLVNHGGQRIKKMPGKVLSHKVFINRHFLLQLSIKINSPVVIFPIVNSYSDADSAVQIPG